MSHTPGGHPHRIAPAPIPHPRPQGTTTVMPLLATPTTTPTTATTTPGPGPFANFPTAAGSSTSHSTSTPLNSLKPRPLGLSGSGPSSGGVGLGSGVGASSVMPNAATIASTSSSSSKPTEVKTDPRTVVSKLLFVHGDVESPSSDTVDYVLDMAHDFMLALMRPVPPPRPTPPTYTISPHAQTLTTSTLRHRLRGPHNRKKLAVLQETIIKQKLAADRAKKSAAIDRKSRKKPVGAGGQEDEMDVEDFAANMSMPGFGGLDGFM